MAHTHTPQQLICRDILTHVSLGLYWPEVIKGGMNVTNKFGYNNTSVSLSMPVMHQYTEGWDMTGKDSDIINHEVVFRKGVPIGVPVTFTPEDMQYYYENQSNLGDLRIKSIQTEYIKPAADAIASGINRRIRNECFRFYWRTGTPGVPLTQWNQFRSMAARFDVTGIPAAQRKLLVSPETGYSLAEELKNAPNEIGGKPVGAYEEALIGKRMLKFDALSAPDYYRKTTGAFAGTIQVDGANQQRTYETTGQEYDQVLVLKGFTATTGTVKKGDVFTLAGVKAVDPRPSQSGQSKDAYAFDQQFVVLDDATADATGKISARISPPIIVSGPYQTCQVPGNAVANNLAVTFMGAASTSYDMAVAFHPMAWAYSNLKMPTLEGGVTQETQTVAGLTGTLAKYASGDTYRQRMRMDVDFNAMAIASYLGGTITA